MPYRHHLFDISVCFFCRRAELHSKVSTYSTEKNKQVLITQTFEEATNRIIASSWNVPSESTQSVYTHESPKCGVEKRIIYNGPFPSTPSIVFFLPLLSGTRSTHPIVLSKCPILFRLALVVSSPFRL